MIQKNNEAMPVKNRIEQLIKAMSEGIWEKDYIFALGLLTAVAEESLFLLGPPGTGKSLVARRLKQVFKDSRSFEYLMSRFSTPDEIFGPVSIKKRTATNVRPTASCRRPTSCFSTKYGKLVRLSRMPC